MSLAKLFLNSTPMFIVMSAIAVWPVAARAGEVLLGGSDAPETMVGGAKDTHDYFTQQFTNSTNDLDYGTLRFAPDGSSSFYSSCWESATCYQTDPSGGTVLALGLNTYVQVNVGAGKQVWLYGVPYSTFYVGTNGYITFGSGDYMWSESLERHFAWPRISGLFDYLYPPYGGTISWKQLPDRVAVTYDGVYSLWPYAPNSFQIEMYFDGRIEITYLAIASESNLVGLSAGTGVPSDFVMSNFNDSSVCDVMRVLPTTEWVISGYVGGPFTSSEERFILSNSSENEVDWTVGSAASWLGFSPSSGTLAVWGGTADVTALVNATANSLAPGSYVTEIVFTNTDSGYVRRRLVELTVLPIPGEIAVTDSVSPIDDLSIGFGDVIKGLSRTEQVTVTNENTSFGLVVTGVRFSDTGTKGAVAEADVLAEAKDSSEVADRFGTFRATNLPIFPYTIAPGSSVTFDVTYAPFLHQLDTSYFVVDSNDEDEPSVAVELTGTGIHDNLAISPIQPLSSLGYVGGPFAPESITYTLTNTGSASLDWAVANTEAWLDVTPANGSLAAGHSVFVVVALNASANGLPADIYVDRVTFVDVTNGVEQPCDMRLKVDLFNEPCHPSPPDGVGDQPTYVPLSWSTCGEGSPSLAGTWFVSYAWYKGSVTWYLREDGSFTDSLGASGTWLAEGQAFTLFCDGDAIFYGKVESTTRLSGYLDCDGMTGSWSADRSKTAASSQELELKPGVAVFGACLSSALSSAGLSCARYYVADIGLVDLSAFQKVIICPNQEEPFYDILLAHRAAFESYVEGGGILQIDCADYTMTSFEETLLPGGFIVAPGVSMNPTIVDPSHPLVTTPNLITDGFLSVHYPIVPGYFLVAPAEAHTIMQSSETGNPCCMELAMGFGRLLVTTMGYDLLDDNNAFLTNTVEYGYGNGVTTYDVYLDTSNPPTTAISTGNTTLSVTPSTLALGEQYFWQVVARRPLGNVPGPVWSFTTSSIAGPNIRVITPMALEKTMYTNDAFTFYPGFIVGNIGSAGMHFQADIRYRESTGTPGKDLGAVCNAVESSIARSGALKGAMVARTSSRYLGKGEPEEVTEPGTVGNVRTAAEAGVKTSSSLDVAVYGAENHSTWLEDVQTKLLGTGAFNSVSVFNVATYTPTISEVQVFDAVMVFSDADYSDATALGNVMADYASTYRGGVVCALFELGDSVGTGSMQGRWLSNGYPLMDRSDVSWGQASLGTILMPSHPLMSGVSRFKGGSGSARPATMGVYPDTYLVAKWSDGHPLAAVGNVAGINRADLGFFPVSGDAAPGSWDSSTDGATLMANALTWVAHSPQWLSIQTTYSTPVRAGYASEQYVRFASTGLAEGVYRGEIVISSDDLDTPTVSVPCTLMVVGPPTIAVQPASTTRCLGGTATFGVTISGGTLPIAYQWRKDGADIPHATMNWYSRRELTLGDEGLYSVLACDSNSSCIESDAAQLTVGTVCLPVFGPLGLVSLAALGGLGVTVALRRTRRR